MKNTIQDWYTPILTTVLSGLLMAAIPALWNQGRAICETTKAFSGLVATVEKQGKVIELHNQQIFQLQLNAGIKPLTADTKAKPKPETL